MDPRSMGKSQRERHKIQETGGQPSQGRRFRDPKQQDGGKSGAEPILVDNQPRLEKRAVLCLGECPRKMASPRGR